MLPASPEIARPTLLKTSYFDEAEQAGFEDALKDIPIVSMVTLVPSLFRLLRYGAYSNSTEQNR
jgi:hypothetical protein